MNDYYGGSYFFGGDGFYVPGHQSSSEWSASSSAGTPMTREPSGESAISTYSNELVQSPSSEYGAYESWLPVAVGNQEPPWSPPMSDSSHEITSSPITLYPLSIRDYTTGNSNDYNTGVEDNWWRNYIFVTNLEPGQEPFWQLKPGLEPTDELPATRAQTDDQSAKDSQYICIDPGCTKSFRRKADLERHLAQIHTPKEKKSKYPCDWKRCQRAREPFGRRDHQRDHYRSYHHEDLMPRGSSGKDDWRWWDSRVINSDWWRCARCLSRVKVGDYGYNCPRCKIPCEQERQFYRKAR
ncbi:hypothetical protein F4803DRAFT_48592 [Xylaria telfairii]|nr:hypothetical protein F4803DRAFT_48592 [Xylaria telfairii]